MCCEVRIYTANNKIRNASKELLYVLLDSVTALIVVQQSNVDINKSWMFLYSTQQIVLK